MTFRAPSLLWLAAVVPFALMFFAACERRRERIARRFVSERLRGVANPARALRPLLLALALLAGVIALAGPQLGVTTIPIETRESNRVIAIDVSMSMAADDVGTTRLDAAKAIAKRIVDASPGRIGLIVFELQPEVVAPLTTDSDAVAALIESIQPGEVDQPGSDLGAALTASLRLLDSDPGQKGDIVLITDGEEQGTRLDETLQRLKQRGVAVSPIVIGSQTGSRIPKPGGGMLTDDNDQVVTTYAHPEVAERIASATGGTAYVNPFERDALSALAASAAGGTSKRKNIEVPIDRYQWPLSVAFVCVLLGSLANRGAE